MAAGNSRLLVIGASARAAVQSLQRAGYAACAADLFADQDLSACCETIRIESYPAGFAAAFASQDLTAWMYTGGLENYPALIDRWAWRLPLAGNDGSRLRASRDPRRLARELRAAALAFPRTHFDEPPPPQGAWLWKAYHSCAGLSVHPWTAASDPGDAAVHEPGTGYWQEHSPGVPCGALFVASEEQVQLIGVTEQRIDPAPRRPFRYAGSLGPLAVPSAIRSQLDRLGEVLGKRLGLRGLVGADFLLQGEQIWVLEVNPRYTASVEVLERACRGSLGPAHLACFHSTRALGRGLERPSPAAPAQGMHGKQILYARRNARVTPALSALAADWNAQPEGPWIADLPAAGTCIEAHQPLVTIFARGAGREEVLRELAAREAEFRTAGVIAEA